MSETPQEYNEPVPADPPEEIDRPAYNDAGDGELNPGPEPTPDENADKTSVSDD